MNGNGEEPQFTDAVGKTVPRPFVPPQVASPINLLNPDRYEFYTFNDNGELVKRLMTLKEIQSIVANGNGATIGDNESESQSVLLNTIPLSNMGAETKVQDIVDNVQNVLSREIENNKNASSIPTQLLDTPDVSSSWSMILPAIFGNTGDEILPHKPISMTPEAEIDDMTTTTTMKTRKPTTTTTTKVATTPIKTSTTPVKTSTRVKTTKAPTTTKRVTTLPPSTKAAITSTATQTKTQTQTTSAATSTMAQPTSTKKQTTKAKPKPTVTTTRSTTQAPPTLATEPFTESVKATVSPSTTIKPTTVKKTTKRTTSSPLYKRPLTNSPIIIEKIPKRPLLVESKTEGIEIETKTPKVTQSPATTVQMKVNPTTRASVTTTRKTTTEAPVTTTTTKQPTTTTTATTLSNSEEDRQDFAINQIIGSLQSDLFKPYEAIMTTTEEDIETTTMSDLAMEKLGDLNLIPDKVLLPDELFVDEEEPIVKNLPTTTVQPEDEIMTTDAPTFEKLEATTLRSVAAAVSLENSEVMQTIEKLIKEQVNAKTKTKPEKLDVLGFDDDDETEIKLKVKETLDSSKNLTHDEFITKAATAASILSTNFSPEPTTTAAPQAFEEESDTTVPTILSEALSNVIELMIREQEAKKTTTAQPDEPTEFDLNKILHHYEDLNTKQDQLEALSMLSEKFATTTARPRVEDQTVPPASQEVETSVVKETSSVSMKAETQKPAENVEATTESGEFSTFFFVDGDSDETTIDPLGDFTTEQFVMTEKRISDRKDQSFTTVEPTIAKEMATESEEDSGDLVSDVLNAIGIASDEEDMVSGEKLKNNGESQESDEVEHALSSISLTLDKTLVSDVESDISLTSKIASGLFSVADSISDTINGDDESEETTTEEISTTITPKLQATTEKPAESTEKLAEPTEKIAVTEKIEDQTELPADEPQISAEKNETGEMLDLETASSGDKKPQLNIIRKDNSLEEIEFITPPTPTSTKIPDTPEGNFIKIENIATSTSNPKHTGFKNKGEKPSSVTRSTTTTAKSSSLPEAAPTKITELATERVPLIEVSKPSQVYLSSTEDNLVEIKVQTKPTTPPSVEEHQAIVSSSQSIKQSIKNSQQPQARPQSPPIDLSSTPGESLGLAASTAHLNKDLSDFAKLCNELAFSFWKSITADGISQSRSVIISPFALTSTLSMIFLGARGQTSGEMNDLLRLDDMVTFNPHVVFRNISESIEQSRKSGIAAAAFVRELYSDRAQGKLLPYFKEKAQQFYGAHVEEVNFNVINDILRRRTNLLVKRHTFSKINEYLKTNNIWVNEPLAAVSANVFLVSFG